jgi:predicted  nucleic acid-binding Zn-ribbon protein
VSSESVIPKRRFGGYRKEDIDQIVADRDRMVRRAEERVHAAEARIVDLESQLEAMAAQQTRNDRRLQAERVGKVEAERDALQNDLEVLRERLTGREAEVESLARELSELRAVHEETGRLLAEAREDASLFLTDELQTILTTAKASARKMMERARVDGHRQIAQANQWWEEVKAEVERFGAWREQVEPMLRTLQSRVHTVQSSVATVSARMQEAMSTMQEALQSIDEGIELLDAAFDLPEQGSLQPPVLEEQGSPGADGAPSASEGAEATDHPDVGASRADGAQGADGGESEGSEDRAAQADGRAGQLYVEPGSGGEDSFDSVYDYLT